MVRRLEDLRALLEAYHPYDAEEEDDVGRMLALCSASGDPFARDHFDPGHFTASAFILSPNKDALLLIFHKKLKRWLQPGGHVEPGDRKIFDAARREILEEVGLEDLPLRSTGIFDVDIHEIPALGAEPPHSHFDVRFAFVANDLDFRADSDAERARFAPLSELSQQSSDRSVLRAVWKLHKR